MNQFLAEIVLKFEKIRLILQKVLMCNHAALLKKNASIINISHKDSHFGEITSLLNTRTHYQWNIKVSNTHCYVVLSNPYFSKSNEKWKI